jgi:hypothetical protein
MEVQLRALFRGGLVNEGDSGCCGKATLGGVTCAVSCARQEGDRNIVRF